MLQWGRCPDSAITERTDLWQINPHNISSVVSDKRKFARLNLPYMLDWTEDKAEAQGWAGERGTKVVCRTELRGHSGAGIVIARNPDQVVDAPLYSSYFKKVREYRVFMSAIMLGTTTTTKAVHVVSKRNTGIIEDRDQLLIRSGTHGWVYQVEDMSDVHDSPTGRDMLHSCHTFMTYLADSIDLTNYAWLLALDVAQDAEGSCRILEANMAPGLNDTTAQAIADACDGIQHTINERGYEQA